MDVNQRLKLLLGVVAPFLLALLLYLLVYCFRVRVRAPARSPEDGYYEPEAEGVVGFAGGEGLTAQEILDAPGEVVAKSSYGTLYRAAFAGTEGSAVLLRFVRPACAARREEVVPAARAVAAAARHANLVPLTALYVGPRGEKLFVHPFFDGGTLAHFLKEGKAESHRWEIIHKLSLGVARGLDHLHNHLHKPIIHGNLKSTNVLIDDDHHPRLTDYALHLVLTPTASQEMLEASAARGYNAPELIKMKDASKETDVYSLGVVFLEILTRKEPTNLHLPASSKMVFPECNFNETLGSKNKACTIEEGLIKFFHLAMACCSASPVLRPDTKQIITRLEEL